MLDGAMWVPIEGNNSTDDLFYATHEGVLEIGELKLRVYQLNTGQRVIEESDLIAFLESMGR